MNIIANICLSVALLIALPVAYMGLFVPPRPNSLDLTFGYLILMFWFCLMLGLGISIARGGFDWLWRGRFVQCLMVVSACTAMMVVNSVYYFELFEPWETLAWFQRLLIRCVFLLPLIAAISSLYLINPTLGAGLSPQRWRLPLVASGGVSLLLICLMLGMLVYAQRSHTSAEARAEIAVIQQRESSNLVEVQTLDPVKNFRALLLFSNIFNAPEIREIALAKLASQPSLTTTLIQHLREGSCDEPLIYLQGLDTPISQALAEPVREGIVCMAERVRKTLREDSMQYDVNFDSDTSRVLAVADRFKSFGVDYVPAMRAYRAAMDEPNRNNFVPRCRATIDKWMRRSASDTARFARKPGRDGISPELQRYDCTRGGAATRIALAASGRGGAAPTN